MSAKPKRLSSRPSAPAEEHVFKGDDQPTEDLTPAGNDEPRGGLAADEVPTALVEVPEDELRALDQPEFSPAFLYVERGPGMGQLLELKQGPVEIGRASTADLRLQHPSISRRHVEVRRVRERFFLKDLGSQNGTLVNKVRITAEIELRPMATIGVGTAVIRLRGPSGKPEQGRRPLVASQRSDTAVVARPLPPPRRRSVVPIAVFAGAVGFALAGVLALALSHLRSPDPTATPPDLARPNEPRALPAGVTVLPSLEQPAPSRAEVDSPSRANRPAAIVHPSAPVIGPRSPPAPPAPLPRAENAKAKGSRASILSAYERGDAEASLSAAKQAADQELVTKLSGFLEASAAGKRAKEARDVGAAIASLQKALAWDEQISSGWGKYAGEIRRELAQLQVLTGKQRESQGQPEAAQKAYEAALAQDPANEVAAVALERLTKKAGKSPDEAFEEAPPPEKEARKAAAKKTIDDAFGE